MLLAVDDVETRLCSVLYTTAGDVEDGIVSLLVGVDVCDSRDCLVCLDGNLHEVVDMGVVLRYN